MAVPAPVKTLPIPFFMYFLLNALTKEDFPVFGKPQIRML